MLWLIWEKEFLNCCQWPPHQSHNLNCEESLHATSCTCIEGVIHRWKNHWGRLKSEPLTSNTSQIFLFKWVIGSHSKFACILVTLGCNKNNVVNNYLTTMKTHVAASRVTFQAWSTSSEDTTMSTGKIFPAKIFLWFQN